MLTAYKLARFEKLQPGAAEALGTLCKDAESVSQHGVISHQGTAADAVIVMLAGWAIRWQWVRKERRQITAFLLPGDFLDVSSIPGSVLDYNLSAVGPARIARIQRKDWLRMLQAEPTVTAALRISKLVDEAIARSWMSRLGRQEALAAIANLLCELWARGLAANLIVDGALSSPLTQLIIADATGLTVVHVNRTLKMLRTEGLIDLREYTLRIPDFDRLAAVGDFNTPWLSTVSSTSGYGSDIQLALAG